MSSAVEVGRDHQVIKLKLMVDKARNRVVFAEADHEFMDILLSFLTLPLGTILKLLGEDIVQMGSISRIYESVSSLEAKHLRTPTCKTMLLTPKNIAAEVRCTKLKININPASPGIRGKVFYCPYSSYHYSSGKVQVYSIYPDAPCFCSRPMGCETTVEEDKSMSTDGSGDGVFVKRGASNFIITDDLQIIPSSFATLIALFKQLGVDDGNELEERTVEIQANEVLQLLKFVLLSKSTFTNTFLLKKDSWIIETVKFESSKADTHEKKPIVQKSSMTLKLLISKSNKKVLFAEAGVDVVDLLFSFLVYPLGAVIKLLGKSSTLGCVDNLYKGAQELSNANYIKSEVHKAAMLVSPKLAPHFSFEDHPFQMNEYVQFVYDSKSERLRFAKDATAEQGGSSSSDSSEKTGQIAVIMDNKSPPGETDSGKGYLKEPATFMITDNLVVTPLSSTSCIAKLNQINVSINDVEERVVTLGKEEALNLLKASLVSKSALSDVFIW